MSSTRSGAAAGAVGAAITPIPELPGEFEKALPAKLSQAEDVQRYLAASPAWVRVESERVARTLTRFAEAVADAMESPRCAHDFLQQLDLRSVSRDHNWRRTFAELVDRDPCFDGHKRTLLIRYLQYLSERKRLLDYVGAQHDGLEETAARVFDAKVERERAPDRVELTVGETALIELRDDGRARFWFGSVPFEVHARSSRARAGLPLRGPQGYEKALRLGRNIAGRHPECDVVLNPAWRTLSRVHAILEWDREAGPRERAAPARSERLGHLRITNLSTQGTSVAAG